MAEIKDYEDVSLYPVSDQVRDEMFSLQSECSVVWSTKDGWPVASCTASSGTTTRYGSREWPIASPYRPCAVIPS